MKLYRPIVALLALALSCSPARASTKCGASFALLAGAQPQLANLDSHSLTWLILRTLLDTPVGEIAQAKLRLQTPPVISTDFLLKWNRLNREERLQQAAESLLSIPQQQANTALRAFAIEWLHHSQLSGQRSVEALLPLARGVNIVDPQELAKAESAIRSIGARRGSIPLRHFASQTRYDTMSILLQEPIRQIEPLGGGQNSSLLVTFTNGRKAVFKPRSGEVTYGQNHPGNVGFTREEAATHLIEDLLKNRQAYSENLSPFFVPEQAVVVLEHEGRSYGIGSLQLYQEPALNVETLFLDPRYAAAREKLLQLPQWQDWQNRLRVLDFLQGNIDRLPFELNGRSHPKNFLLVGLPDFSPEALARADFSRLKFALIDNAGQDPHKFFSIDGLGHFPLREDVPADLRQAILTTSEEKIRNSLAPYLDIRSINEMVERFRAAKNRLR